MVRWNKTSQPNLSSSELTYNKRSKALYKGTIDKTIGGIHKQSGATFYGPILTKINNNRCKIKHANNYNNLYSVTRGQLISKSNLSLNSNIYEDTKFNGQIYENVFTLETLPKNMLLYLGLDGFVIQNVGEIFSYCANYSNSSDSSDSPDSSDDITVDPTDVSNSIIVDPCNLLFTGGCNNTGFKEFVSLDSSINLIDYNLVLTNVNYLTNYNPLNFI
jgi:hypothetical protein